jgi:P pilus assembly chaperone PapD
MAMTEQEFWAIMQTVEPPHPLFYRLYHNEHGVPLFYSMEDLPGNYIEIDQETFSRSPRNCRVKNGKLYYTNLTQTSKLIPTSAGTACDPRDICVVVDNTNTEAKHWSLKINEEN